MAQGITNLLPAWNRLGYQRGGPPGGGDPGMTYTAPSGPSGPPGGGDPGMTYTARIPSPILKKDVKRDFVGPKRFDKDQIPKPVDFNKYNLLTKDMANKDLADLLYFKADEDKVWDTAERILQAVKVDKETYNQALGHIKFSGVTDEYGVTGELKDFLASKGYDFNLPAGTITGGKVETAIGPATLEASKNVDDDLQYKIGIDDEFNILPNLTTEGLKYTDKGLEGQVGFNTDLFSTDYDLGDSRWQSMFEGDKAGIGFTGMGPYVDKASVKLEPFTSTYVPEDKSWNVGVDQALTDSGNLRFKSDYDSDDKWNAGIYGNWTWGEDPNDTLSHYRHMEPPITETERFLRENLNKLKTRLNESRGGILGAF